MKALLLLFLLSSLASAEDHVFRGFTLTGSGEPLRKAAMIVTDRRIAWVGPASQLKEQPGASRQDLAGKYVIPGLINLHGHLSLTSGLKQDT
jgi:predicted amidohydrolase YtcJ